MKTKWIEGEKYPTVEDAFRNALAFAKTHEQCTGQSTVIVLREGFLRCGALEKGKPIEREKFTLWYAKAIYEDLSEVDYWQEYLEVECSPSELKIGDYVRVVATVFFGCLVHSTGQVYKISDQPMLDWVNNNRDAYELVEWINGGWKCIEGED